MLNMKKVLLVVALCILTGTYAATLERRESWIEERGVKADIGEELKPQIKAHVNIPKVELRQAKWASFSCKLINCEFTLIIDKVLEPKWKIPVIRLVVLFEDSKFGNQTYYVREAIFDELNSQGSFCCIKLDQKFGTFAPAISYFQPIYKGSDKKLRYYVPAPKTQDLTKEYGNFQWLLTPEQSATMKIRGYRVECWQNGVLIDCKDKVPKTWLQAKKLPLDWYKMYHHEDVFKYNTFE